MSFIHEDDDPLVVLGIAITVVVAVVTLIMIYGH